MNEELVSSLLRLPAGGSNYQGTLEKLTGKELAYCWEHETRKNGLQQIRREMRRREAERRAVEAEKWSPLR